MTPDQARAVIEANDRFSRIDPTDLDAYTAGELAHGCGWLKDLLADARRVIAAADDLPMVRPENANEAPPA